MKMSAHDRIEAIKRHPLCIKHLQMLHKIESESDEKKKRLLRKKLNWKWTPEDFAAVTLTNKEDKKLILKLQERDSIVMINENQFPRPKSAVDYDLLDVQWVYHRKHLYVKLKIDIYRTEKELTKRFAEMVKAWKKDKDIAVPKEKMQGNIEYDKWLIYDKKKKPGMSFLKIALELNGETYPKGDRSPSVNSKLWSPYKRVKRAYQTAEKMIQSV